MKAIPLHVIEIIESIMNSHTTYYTDNDLLPMLTMFLLIPVLLYYFVPAALYCLYNNLQFVNLATYDPTTYYLLLQFRVVVTGVVFQVCTQNYENSNAKNVMNYIS